MESIMKIEPRYPDTLELLLGTGQARLGRARLWHSGNMNFIKTAWKQAYSYNLCSGLPVRSVGPATSVLSILMCPCAWADTKAVKTMN